MSRTSFVLKGSGWYATDYKSTSSSTKTESSASESKPSVEAKPSSDTKAT
jgi:predicted nucleic acid-binding Zn ribbon protein